MSIEKAKIELQNKIDEFCNESGHHEGDTGAFIFVNDACESYADGLSDALNILEKYVTA